MGHANAHALSRVPSQFSIHVHPSQSNDILQAVREQLAGLLLKYSEDLQGVVLAFYQERVLSKQAEVDPYFPFLHVEVAADVLLFQPRPGMQLVGSVNAVGHDYISVLVLGVFNAAIGAEHIRKDFRPQPQEQCWVNKRQPGQVIGLGSSVCFTVQRVLDHVSMFSLAGALLEPGTGLVTDQQQQQQQPHKQKNVKDREKQQQPQSKPDKSASTAAAADGGKKRKADAAHLKQQQQQHLNGAPDKKQKRPKEASAEQQQAPGAEQVLAVTHKKHKKQKDQSREGQQEQQQVAAKDPGSHKKGKDQQQQAAQANGHLQPHTQQQPQEQQEQESSKKAKHKKQHKVAS